MRLNILPGQLPREPERWRRAVAIENFLWGAATVGVAALLISLICR